VPNDPQTPEQWKLCADLAEFLLRVDSARMYGLLETKIAIDPRRCQEVIDRAREMGISGDWLAGFHAMKQQC
jgi:hypothetical protein